VNAEFSRAVVAIIGSLYAVEKEVHEKKLSPDQTSEIRQEESKPVIERIKSMLEKRASNIAPKSPTGKAIRYALERWDTLCVYLSDGRIPIDNNHVENAIRPFVIGRKNWLFSGSPRGARASALFYSLIETAKANGMEPYWYLRYLYEKLPHAASSEERHTLLPHVVDPAIIESFRKGVVA
jgi:transposase